MNEDIPLNASVSCSNGDCGKLAAVIIDPVTQKLTHIVVMDQVEPRVDERLVSVGHIVDTTSDSIRLDCTRDELIHMPKFLERHYIAESNARETVYDAGERGAPNKTVVESDFEITQETHMPAGELAIRPGAHVNASDGRVGQVNEFAVNTEDGTITHLILREGHLWGKKDVTIPLSAIASIQADTVTLNLDKKAVKTLPSVKVARR